MDALYELVRSLEQESFQSVFMNGVKANTRLSSGRPASASIHRFRRILKRFDFRLNLVVFFILNTFFLWDLRQLLALNEWKKTNSQYLARWFSAVAETEVVISLASLLKNKPGWHFPEINDRYFNLDIRDMGHPLIPADRCVTNSFSMEGSGKIAIVTGSNMAGKSTFLRALGTNLVLAYMGAPVFASGCEASHLQLLSSMRVADNLAENTSTFYAELKKLQLIIENVNQRKPVFILLDEVLRGTNSGDRHTGTKALIRQLISQQAVCVIATHDTELAKAEAENHPEAIRNYHFDGQIQGEELFFDYRLRKGICESLNATLLMKKIGIHFEE
jgi:DNA mismatch repair ATPase MutS